MCLAYEKTEKKTFSIRIINVVDPDDYPEYVAEENNPKIMESGMSFWSSVFLK